MENKEISTNTAEINGKDNKSVKENEKANQLKEKEKAKKRRAQADFRRKYFDYYDDVKTNIKEDW